MSWIITKDDLLCWLHSLMMERTLIAPTRVDDMILFRPVTRTEEVITSSVNTTLGPKEWLFPPSHAIFSIENRDGDMAITPETMDREMVIFGLHPCDAQGFSIYDLPMLQDPQDDFYKDRRDRTTLIGMSCSAPCLECFCTSTGSGPHDASGVDVMLTESSQYYVVQSMTDKGERLLSSASLKQQDVEVCTPPVISEIPTEGIAVAMRRAFDDQYWNRLADRCIHCNICSYVCPACYCFDMRDYKEKGKVCRMRSWDSCLAPGFTKIAGGHDHRPDKGGRIRQRFAHKLLYFPEEFDGVLGCTGCGRCVRFCPVNIDIREIIGDVQKIGGG